MEKKRIDVLLVEQGFFDSREKAKRAVMAGIVHNDHEIIDKPGTKVPVDMELFVKGTVMPYVSRGGLKLEKALKIFDISMQNRVMVDIGSSTGGFTDCALQNGAQCVYAVDVGTNQLVWKLRNDPRVIVKEKTNFRYATRDLFENGIPNIATIDVSFISLKHIFIPLKDILNENDDIVALIGASFIESLYSSPVVSLAIIKTTSNSTTYLIIIFKGILFKTFIYIFPAFFTLLQYH